MTVDVVVNGEPHRVPEGTTIGLLLDTLGLQRDGIAVAVDRTVVPRSEHDEHIWGRTIGTSPELGHTRRQQ